MERVSRSQAGVLITSVCAGTLPNRSCLYIYIYMYIYEQRRKARGKLETLAKRMKRQKGRG